jgi:hypothetical protein
MVRARITWLAPIIVPILSSNALADRPVYEAALRDNLMSLAATKTRHKMTRELDHAAFIKDHFLLPQLDPRVLGD